MTNEAQTAKIGYRNIIEQKQYLKLIIANLINRFGDSVDLIAFSWLVYSVTGNAAWSAVIYGINKLPGIFLQPFAGALVETRNKKLLMIITDLARGFTIILIVVFMLFDALNAWILVSVTFINSTIETLRLPSGIAITPKLLKREYFSYGLSMNKGLSSISELLGFAAGGTIVALFGNIHAIIIDGITFFLSAFIISLIRYNESDRIKASLNYKSYINTFKEGLSYMFRMPLLVRLCIMGLILNTFLIPANSLNAPYVQDFLMNRVYLMSVISCSYSIGMILGTFGYPSLAQKLSPNSIFLYGGLSAAAYNFTLVAAQRFNNLPLLQAVIVGLFSFLFGFFILVLIMQIQVMAVKSVEESYLARTTAIFDAVNTVPIPLMAGILAFASSFVTVKTIFNLCGAALLVSFIIYRFIPDGCSFKKDNI